MDELKQDLKQFDIIYANFEKKSGSIQNGLRPALVIQNDLGNKHSPTILVLPFTTKLKKITQPTHAVFKSSSENGLTKDSMLLGESLTAISKERIIKKIGHISDEHDQNRAVKVYLSNIVGYKNNKITSMIYRLARVV